MDEEPLTDGQRRASNGDEEPSVNSQYQRMTPIGTRRKKQARKKEIFIYLFIYFIIIIIIYLFTYLCGLGLTKHPFGKPPFMSQLVDQPTWKPQY
jgi:hypothetical protein